jgi:FHS family L-fucose permease-like MFS transporter
MRSVTVQDRTLQQAVSANKEAKATNNTVSSTAGKLTSQPNPSTNQDNEAPERIAFFTSQNYFPNFNISANMTKGLDRVKRFDVQHGQTRPDLQKTVYTPICCASVLFFIWGFAYGLLDAMNNHVRKLMELSRAVSALLAVAYYAAYPVAVFAIAGPLIKRCGYRVTFLTGLFIFAVGNFMMALVAGKLVGMVAASFIVGLGVATLERSANPYVVRCGPEGFRATRINFAQSWAGVGTVISPLAAAGSIVGNKSQKFAAIVHVYLTIGCVIIGIAAFFLWLFFRTQCMPELPADGDEEESHGFRASPIWSCKKLWWGAVANFCNMGCQVAVAQYLMAYLEDNAGLDDTQGAHYLSVAQTAFVVGRFAFAGLSVVVKPRKALGLFIFGCIACSTGAVFARNGAAIAMVVLIMLFEAPLFPTIFETATSGLEKLASRAEDIMISSICGGALLSPLFGLLADKVAGGWNTPAAAGTDGVIARQAQLPRRLDGKGNQDHPISVQHATRSSTLPPTTPNAIAMTGTATAFSIVVGSFCIVAFYVLIINIYKPYKKTLDASRTQETDIEGPPPDTEGGKSSNLTSSSASALPPIMLTTFKSKSLDDLTIPDETAAEQRAEALRAELKEGTRTSQYGSELKEPENTVLRKTKTAPT